MNYSIIRTCKAFFVGGAIIFLAASAAADPILVIPTSDGSGVEITINESDCAFWAPCDIQWQLSDGLDGLSNWLDIGDSWTFDFFDLTVSGLGEVESFLMSATLAFVAPDTSSSASGEGNFWTFFGIYSEGEFDWTANDGGYDLGDGTYLGVHFEDLDEAGFGNTTTVSATVSRSYISSTGSQPTAISEPGTLGLLGLGLIMIALSRRKFPAENQFRVPRNRT